MALHNFHSLSGKQLLDLQKPVRDRESGIPASPAALLSDILVFPVLPFVQIVKNLLHIHKLKAIPGKRNLLCRILSKYKPPSV